jgi:hypothetical protein
LRNPDEMRDGEDRAFPEDATSVKEERWEDWE